MIVQALLSIVIFIFGFAERGYALYMTVSPKSFNEFLHDKINITCTLDGAAFWAQDVMVIQIERRDQQPMAVVDAKNGLSLGPNSESNVQADGRIDHDANASFLTVTIEGPGVRDSGTYWCVAFYLDETYQLKEMRTAVNVTLDKDVDVTKVIKYLSNKVSRLEKTINEQQNVIHTQDEALRKQNDTLKEILKVQRDSLNDQNVKLNDNLDFVMNLLKKHNDTLSEHDDKLHDMVLINDLLKKHNFSIKAHSDKIQEQQVLLNDIVRKDQGDIQMTEYQLQDAVAELNSSMMDYNVRIQERLDQIQQRIGHTNTTETTTRCAFSMGYNSEETLTSQTSMKFTTSVTNIGNAYDTDTGLFTAPVDGVYVFHLVVRTSNAKDWATVYLRVNGSKTVAAASAVDDSKPDQTSASSVLSLRAGDTVDTFMRSIGGPDSSLTRGLWSTFSGFLLYTI